MDRAAPAGGRLQGLVVGRLCLRRFPPFQRPAGRQIPVHEVVGTRLVRDKIGPGAAPPCTPRQFGQDLRCVAEESHRHRFLPRAMLLHALEGIFEAAGLFVEVLRPESRSDTGRIALDDQRCSAGEACGKRLGTTHAA